VTAERSVHKTELPDERRFGREAVAGVKLKAGRSGECASGSDEVRSFFADDWFQAFPFEEWEVELDELIDNGDKVIAIARQRGRSATSGVGAELEQAHIFTLRDGEVVRAESYLDREKALEAAGLRE
jgi:ketosteroid isomerase-like protein